MKKIFIIFIIVCMFFVTNAEAMICTYENGTETIEVNTEDPTVEIDFNSELLNWLKGLNDGALKKYLPEQNYGKIRNWDKDEYGLGYTGNEIVTFLGRCPKHLLFGTMTPFGISKNDDFEAIFSVAVGVLGFSFNGVIGPFIIESILKLGGGVLVEGFPYIAEDTEGRNDIEIIKENLDTKQIIYNSTNIYDPFNIIPDEKLLNVWIWSTGHPLIFDNTNVEEPIEEEPFIPSSCLNFDEDTCETNKYFSCIWNEKGYCNTDTLHYVKCGDFHDIPRKVPSIFSFAINFLKILAPIVLIVMGVISLVKALFSAKEDEIRKAQGGLVRKLIAAVMLFLVVYIVQYIILTVADDNEKDNISNCLSCFLNNECGNSTYYKTASGSNFYCTSLNNHKSYECEDYYADDYKAITIQKYTLGS